MLGSKVVEVDDDWNSFLLQTAIFFHPRSKLEVAPVDQSDIAIHFYRTYSKSYGILADQTLRVVC